jgi:hypothetical protein
MKSMFKLLGIIAIVAVIGFTMIACDTGGGGGGGSGGGSDVGEQKKPDTYVPQNERYTSLDANLNEYVLDINEVTTGRAALNYQKNYTYKLTITLKADGSVATSKGTVKINYYKNEGDGLIYITTLDLTNTDTGKKINITIFDSDKDTGNFAINSIEGDTIPVDTDSPVKNVEMPKVAYLYNEANAPNGAGAGYFLIKGDVDSAGKAKNIESSFNGKPVIGILKAFADNKDLKSITIPANITYIGNAAFQNTGLTTITIPATVKKIEGYSNFADCAQLATVTFAPNSQLEVIGGQAFFNCSKLTAIDIPKSVKAIDGWETFENCTSLTTVTFETGSQLQRFGSMTFAGCSALTSITIPDTVTTIGLEGIWGGTFDNCTKINEITIPESVSYLGPGTFVNWTDTQTIYVEGYYSREEADDAWAEGWNWTDAIWVFKDSPQGPPPTPTWP